MTTDTGIFIIDTAKRLVQAVREVGAPRSADTLARRLHKALEELGELAEAYLGITSEKNPKGKTIADVREEAADLYIMLVDCVLTFDIDEMESRVRSVTVNGHDIADAFCDMTDTSLRVSKLIGSAYEHVQSGQIKEFKSNLCQAILLTSGMLFSPGSDTQDPDDIAAVVHTKLAKWTRQRATNETVV